MLFHKHGRLWGTLNFRKLFLKKRLPFRVNANDSLSRTFTKVVAENKLKLCKAVFTLQDNTYCVTTVRTKQKELFKLMHITF